MMKRALAMMPWGLVAGLAAAALMWMAAAATGAGSPAAGLTGQDAQPQAGAYAAPSAIVAAARQAAGLDPVTPLLGDGPRRTRPMLALADPAAGPDGVQSPSATPSLRGYAPPANPDGPITIPCNPLGNSSSLTSCPSFFSAGASFATDVPRSSSVARLRLPMSGSAMAS